MSQSKDDRNATLGALAQTQTIGESNNVAGKKLIFMGNHLFTSTDTSDSDHRPRQVNYVPHPRHPSSPALSYIP